jgi:lipoprotein-anchoring transpeptidase ErfK/SrfK
LDPSKRCNSLATKRSQLGAAVVAALAAATVAGCGGERTADRHAERDVVLPPKAAVRAAVVERCRAGSAQALGSPREAFAAVVLARASAYRAPGGGVVRRFGKLNVNGVPTVFGILGARVDAACRPQWYRVQLPIRPNGATGWVRAQDVWVGKVDTRIAVDVSDRRLTLYRDGRRVLTTTVAVGTSATPTPTGRYYVNQRLVPAETGGPFGPGALGISAYSDVLTGWAQGGPIAIHGTNQPWSIGRAASNGCIRVPNDVLKRIFDTALAGTPVVIRA